MFVLFFPKQQSVKRVVLMQQRFPDISKTLQTCSIYFP